MSDTCGPNCRGTERRGDCGGPGAWDGPCGDPSCAGCFGPGYDHSACDPCPNGCEKGKLPCVCDGTGWEWVDVPCSACGGEGWRKCDCGGEK